MGKLGLFVAEFLTVTDAALCINAELTTFSLCSRDERRWIEKQNRAARALRKKEEMNRIRILVGEHTNCSCKRDLLTNSRKALFFFCTQCVLSSTRQCI